MLPKKTSLDHLSPEQKQAYKIISRGLQFKNASKEQKEEYQRFLDKVEKSAIQRGITDLVTLVGIFRKRIMYSILITEANIPEPYKPLMSLVASVEGEQLKRGGLVYGFHQKGKQVVGQAKKNAGFAGSSTTNAPSPKLKKKNSSK